MKNILLLLFILFVFNNCSNEDPVPVNETVDEAILGAWQVAYSQTITGVRMLSNGSLALNGEAADTAVFTGISNTPVNSYMFGRDENIIDIKNDNKIKIYLINSRGGVTISTEQVIYFVSNDTLYRKNADIHLAHKYRLQNDSLIIEHIPNENTSWTYIISKYSRIIL